MAITKKYMIASIRKDRFFIFVNLLVITLYTAIATNENYIVANPTNSFFSHLLNFRFCNSAVSNCYGGWYLIKNLMSSLEYYYYDLK